MKSMNSSFITGHSLKKVFFDAWSLGKMPPKQWFHLGIVISVTLTLLQGVTGRSSALSLRLVEAARDGSVDTVRDLLDVGIDPESLDDERHTGLILASAGGHVQVLDELLNRGANEDAKDRDGYTGLMLAASRGHIDIVKKIIRTGVNLETQGFLWQRFAYRAIILES